MSDQDTALLTGNARYLDDVDLPGQLHLALVRSPLANGRLRGIDCRRALAAPGVHAVLTASDLAQIPLLPVRSAPYPGIEDHLPPVIAADRVRFVGQPVAVVVADDPYRAEDATELVRLDLDGRPAVVRSEESPDELFDFRSAHGDVDALFDRADLVVERTFSLQRQTAVPLEGRGLLAHWDGDHLDLWGPTKYIQHARATVASFFGVDRSRVVCHRVDVGGMFGVRGELYPEDFLVPWAARTLGRPVKWTEDRREHLTTINHSREQEHRVRVALAADGQLLALDDDIRMDMGAYAGAIGGRIAHMVMESLPGPYRWGAHRSRTRGFVTNKPPVGVMRGPATFEATFVRERALDIAAAELGWDPVDLRRRNLLAAGDMPHLVPLGPDVPDAEYDSGAYPAVLDDMLETVDWPTLRAELEERRAGGECVGAGLALFVNHSGYGAEESVGLDLTTEGRFVLRTSGAEVGQGFDRMARLVSAEALGVDATTVDVRSGSSDAHDGGQGTFSSRSTLFVGSAAIDAADAMIAEAAIRAAELAGRPVELGRTPEGLSDEQGDWRWKDLAPLSVIGRHEMREPTFGFGGHIAVARVDPGTGAVVLERLLVAYDCGRAVDRPSAHGQLVGGTAQALGETLLEELRFDPGGQPLSTTFMDYLLPTTAETPPIESRLLELSPSPRNPLGAKGVGEAGVYGVPAAVANAVADALGAHAGLTRLPLRPDAVLAARDAADARRRGAATPW